MRDTYSQSSSITSTNPLVRSSIVTINTLTQLFPSDVTTNLHPTPHPLIRKSDDLAHLTLWKRAENALSDKTGNLVEIDYSTAEALAFRTILEEGYGIRLSGQDSGQGAFSQKHALLTDQVVEGRTIVPLNQLSAKNSQPGNLEIVNSPLSKYPVLGFELGLS
ncbi:hypothetical protein PPACK8108_LOCUS4182 [Phakopsora pachyrhizi]|uniref:Transketolase-like pyrimidine-binding domain-containing protein n=1 Tax=Phakopsora pachyrhizi TaxID=170000 RepID=A0AAV0AQ41_PHAPC|nr:hypothetical protein PPACK8108_LOCUS4182 [Phakopsora pachyrhizi]